MELAYNNQLSILLCGGPSSDHYSIYCGYSGTHHRSIISGAGNQVGACPFFNNNQLNYARVSIMPVQNIYQYPDVAGHNNVAISQSPNPAQGICGACLNYGFSL